MLPERVKLNNGFEMPSIGYGTWRVPPQRARDAVLTAIRAGYRLIDTSLAYWNEREVGEAIRDCGLPREELFVTTKLEGEHHGRDLVAEGFRRSLANLDIGHIDLYLVHSPGGQRLDTWKGMEDLLTYAGCRAIGVSNYQVAHLEEVLEHSEVVPAVNQIEVHPFLVPREVIAFCRANGIQVESYSPLMQAEGLYDRRIRRVAERRGRTPAQVVLRWHLQHDLIPIPRSVDPVHIAENLRVFDFALAEEDMRALDAIDQELRLAWDPGTVD